METDQSHPEPAVDGEPDPFPTSDRGHDVTFIVGPARSGTSLLYKLLSLHPDASWISNWVARYPRFPQLAGLNRIARRWPSQARRVWFDPESNAYVYGARRPLTQRIFPMPVEGEPVYAACGVTRDGEGSGSGDPTVRLPRVFESVRSFGGGRRFISKRIGNNLRIPLLLRAFPSARFVEMVRDGRAVAYSLAHVDWWADSFVWWYGDTPRAWEANGGDPWEIRARNWVEELRRVRDGLAPVADERIHRVRYEELVADPLPTLERLAAFVGLDRDGSWAGSLRQLAFPNRNERWKERLEPEVAARITTIQREELDELGYTI